MPDPYPGRCKNHRSVLWYAESKNVRCLDYEGTDHVCTFEQPPAAFSIDVSQLSSSVMREPEQWVKPASED